MSHAGGRRVGQDEDDSNLEFANRKVAGRVAGLFSEKDEVEMLA